MSVSERGVARQSPSRPEICSAQGCQLTRPSSPAISSAHTVGDGHWAELNMIRPFWTKNIEFFESLKDEQNVGYGKCFLLKYSG